ncbi:MAG: porin family protein [Chlorobiaceae bacterium]|nr:porin family protein [Chlorobiaceae bacterium]
MSGKRLGMRVAHELNMKKSILPIFLLAGLLSGHAVAAPYVSVSAGTGVSEDSKLDGAGEPMANAFAFNGAVGYNFGAARIEAASGYQEHGYPRHPEFGNLECLLIMANGYYDFEASRGLRPYIMAGIGSAHVHTEDDFVDDYSFAWQIGTGLGLEVARNITFDVGYCYFRVDHLESRFGGRVEWGAHNILAGIRYEF